MFAHMPHGERYAKPIDPGKQEAEGEHFLEGNIVQMKNELTAMPPRLAQPAQRLQSAQVHVGGESSCIAGAGKQKARLLTEPGPGSLIVVIVLMLVRQEHHLRWQVLPPQPVVRPPL